MSETIGSAKNATRLWMVESSRLNLRLMLMESLLSATSQHPQGLADRLAKSRCDLFRALKTIRDDMAKSNKGDGRDTRPPVRKRTRKESTKIVPEK